MTQNSTTGWTLWKPASRRLGVVIALFFSLSGPLWAPVSPGWCKSQATLTPMVNLSFGGFVSFDVGSVNVDTNGVRSSTGGITLLGGVVSPATFAITGCANYTYAVVLPPATNLVAGVNTMSITTWQTNPTGSGILDANGQGTLILAGILNVGFQQPAGAYSGTFTMEVVFQ